MTNAKLDENWKPTLIGVSSGDGVTPIRAEIDPGTGELLVKASVSVSGADGAILDGSDSGIKATVKDLTNSNPLAVAIVDTSGDQISSFGGGTQYTDGASSPAHPVGSIPVFDDAGTITAVSGTNPLPVSASIDTTGLATSTKQDDEIALLTSIQGELSDVSTGTKQSTQIDLLTSIDNKVFKADTDNVTVVSSTLPTGAATSAKQDTCNTSLATVAGAVAGTEMQVDVLTMPTTTVQATNLDIRDLSSASDSVAAAQSGTWTVQPGNTANTTAWLVTGTGGSFPVTDSGGSLTVDNGGTFAVQAAQSGTWNITNVSGTVSLPTGASTLAEQQTQTASLSVLDDWDESDRAKVNIISGQAGVAAGVGATGATTQRVVVANDAGRTLVSTGGSASSSGNNTLVTAGTNKLKVYAFSLSTTSTTAVTCIFQSGASGTELWRVLLQAPTSVSTGANLVVQPPAWLFATASATLLNLNLSGAQTVHWSVSYFDEA